MYRCVLFTVFVTALAVSGAKPPSRRNVAPGKDPCAGKPLANTTCDMFYWSGICFDAYDKSGVPGHHICRSHCGLPALNPLANVELAAAFDWSAGYGGSQLAVQCLPDYAPAPGSDMTITCVDGQWSSFTGECLKDCGVPTFSGQLSNVVVLQYGGQLHGYVAVLGCKDPYVADGSMGAVCDANGFWVPIGTGQCVTPCKPTSALDGAFSNTDPPPGTVTYKPGELRVYACTTGHGSPTCNYAECRADGSWLTYGTGCVADCGVPTFSGQLSNVVVLQYGGQLHGNVAVLGCKDPYVADGSMGAVCDANGFWVPFGTGQCVTPCTPTSALDGAFSNTDPPADPPAGTVTYKPGELRVYACTTGHTSPTCNYAECQADGSWLTYGTGCVAEVTVCSGLPPPGYSSIDGGLTATKMCSGGSVLTINCNGGTWPLPSETCPVIVCSGQPPPGYSSPTDDGLTATKTCSDGSVLTINCDGGTWPIPSGACPVPGCGSPPDVVGSVGAPVVEPGQAVGVFVATYTCDPQSTLQAEATAICDGATWTVQAPGCESVTDDCRASLQTQMGSNFPNNIKRCAWFRGYCNCMWEADVTHPDGMTTICQDKFPGISSTMVTIFDADWNEFMQKFGQYDAIGGVGRYWHAGQVTADGTDIVDSYTGAPLLYKATEPTAADAGKCTVFNADLALPANWEFFECTLPKDKQKTVCQIQDPRAR